MDKNLAIVAKKYPGVPRPLLPTLVGGLVILVLSLSACSCTTCGGFINPDELKMESPAHTTQPKVGKIPNSPESSELAGSPNLSGRSYVVKGKRYHLLATADGFREEGLATWYGPGFHGRKTASGEIFNVNKITAAHKTLPMGTKVEVTNLDNGQKIVVRINDRGPFGTKKHIIDLSKKAARSIGVLGVSPVSIRVVP